MITPGEKSGAGRTANRGIGVEVSEGQAFFGHLLNAGSLNPTVVKFEITAAEIIGQNDDDVGRSFAESGQD